MTQHQTFKPRASQSKKKDGDFVQVRDGKTGDTRFVVWEPDGRVGVKVEARG